MPLNLTLASRNLFHDRLRFVATAVGIVFSIVLVMVQMGLYLGFGQMVTSMIDHAEADLWVMRNGTKCFEDPSLLNAKAARPSTDQRRRLRRSPGDRLFRLAAAERRNDPGFPGRIRPQPETLRPWNITEGSAKALLASDAAAVDRPVAVADQLARLAARRGEAEAHEHVVEAALEHPQQVLARDPGLPRRLGVVRAELLLEHAVVAARLLLLTQLDAVLGLLLAPAAVLAGRIRAALDAALVGQAALALEEQLLALAAALLALWERYRVP